MRKARTLFPRLMAVFLSLVILIGTLPIGAMAIDSETTPTDPPGISTDKESTGVPSDGETPPEPTGDSPTDPTDEAPSDPTDATPTDPTKAPTTDPTEETSPDPTDAPATDPTEAPTEAPTDPPGAASTDPTEDPEADPTEEPDVDPTEGPTEEPTDPPTETEPAETDARMEAEDYASTYLFADPKLAWSGASGGYVVGNPQIETVFQLELFDDLASSKLENTPHVTFRVSADTAGSYTLRIGTVAENFDNPGDLYIPVIVNGVAYKATYHAADNGICEFSVDVALAEGENKIVCVAFDADLYLELIGNDTEALADEKIHFDYLTLPEGVTALEKQGGNTVQSPSTGEDGNNVDPYAEARASHACYSTLSMGLDGSGTASFTYRKANGGLTSTDISGIVYHYVDIASNPGYCLQPDRSAPVNLFVTEEATTVGAANTNTRGSKIWTQNLSTAQQDAIAMILLYGAPNSMWGDDTANQGYFAAGQVLVWEIVMGLRSTDFPYNYTSVSNARSLYNLFSGSANFVTGYNAILSGIQSSRTIPSFTSSAAASAPTITLEADGTGYYTATVTDTNGVLSQFDFTDPTGNVTFAKSGNALTIRAKSLPSSTTFSGTRDVYSSTASTFNLYYPGSDNYQTMLTVGSAATQALAGYINLEIKATGKTFTLQKSSSSSISSGNSMYSLAGAKYEVSVGNTLMETLTTDANGRATSSKEYDIGTVVQIKETVAPTGYKLNSTTYTFTISESSNIFSVSDEPIFDPPFAITKVDKSTTNPQGNSSFSGAVFKWEYFANTSWTGTATRTWYLQTNSNGYVYYDPSYLASGYTSDALFISSGNLYRIPLGTVKITEVKNSLGYTVLSNPLYASIVADPSSSDGVKIVWTTESLQSIVNIASGNYGVAEPIDTSLFGSFTLTKTDKDTGAKLAGAKFQVINNSTNSVKIGNYAEAEPGSVCYEFTTDANGQFSSGSIFPLGSYTIKEVSAPAGYQVNTSWTGSFTIAGSGQRSFTFTCQNTGVGHIKFIKATNTGNNLAGWGITLYSDAACSKLVGTYVTGTDGTITTGQLTAGTYYAKETSAPSGIDTSWWVMDASVKTVTISAGQTASVQFSNSHYGRLKITKNTNTGANRDGWVFDVRNSSGTVVTTLTTGADGTVTSGNLVPGTYTVTERSNGNAYWSCDVTAKTVTVVAGQTANVSVTNTHYGRIKVTKTTNTGNNLNGWVFIVKDANGTTVDTLTTGADGTATSKYLLPGKYTVTEQDSTDPYWECDVAAKEVTVVAGSDVGVQVKNVNHGRAKIIKKTNTGENLAGWSFAIYSDSGCTQQVATLTSGTTGATSEVYLEPGTYYWKEIGDNANRFGSEFWVAETLEAQSFEIKPSEEVVLEFTNNHHGKIKILKALDTDGELAGWQFKVTDKATGLEIDGSPFTTNDKGEIETGILMPGEYIIEELFEEDSLFYCKSENPQTVTVVAGEVTEVNFVNALRPGRIEIEKLNFSNEHLAGAKFLLEWSEDGITWTPVTYSDKEDVVKGGCTTEGLTDGWLITDASGIIAFEGLYPSLQYRVTELEAPEGYILLADFAYVDVLPVDDLEVVLTVFNSKGYVLPSTGVTDDTFFLIATGTFITTLSTALGLMVVYYNVSNGRRTVRRKMKHSPKYLRKD